MKSTRFRRRRSRLALPAVAAAALLTFGLASSAEAADGNPDPIPANFDFSDCPPLPEGAEPGFSRCFVAVATSGTFQIGNFDQEIDKPIRITYATFFDLDTAQFTTIFGGLHAEKMLVQGGLFGDPFLTAVYAQPQYAGSFEAPPSLDFEINIGLKVRLINPILGGDCTIGSDDNPIMLHFTTGTTNPPAPNTPITGEPLSIARETPEPIVRAAQHVDNAFAVPGAQGCAFDWGAANWLVNQIGGFPSPAGTNTMIQNEYIVIKTYDEL